MNLEKINGWIGFWLALISIIVAITAFWQIYKQHSLEDNAKGVFKDLETTSKNTNEKLDKQIKDTEQRLENKIKDTNAYLDNKIEKANTQLTNNTERVNKELTSKVQKSIDTLNYKMKEDEARLKRMVIIHLSQSIAQIPDPRYVPGNIEKKELCRQFLVKLADALSDYINALGSNAQDKIMLDEDDIYRLSVMLVHLGYAISMTLSVYSDRDKYKRLITVRKDINNMILCTEGNSRQKKDIIANLKTIHTELIEITN